MLDTRRTSSWIRTVVCLPVLATLARPAASRQDSPPAAAGAVAASSEARLVLEQAARAMGTVRCVRYRARFRSILGAGPEAQRRSIDGDVQLAAPLGAPLAAQGSSAVRVRIAGALREGDATTPRIPFEMTSDGTRVRLRVDVPEETQERVVWEGLLPGAGDTLLGIAEDLRPGGILTADYLSSERAAAPSLLPDEVLDGTTCRKIRLLFPSSLGRVLEEHWLFGAKDHLPREVRRMFAVDGVDVSETLTLEGMSFPEPPAVEHFVLEVPEGWEVAEFEGGHEHPDELIAVGEQAPAFSLQDPSGKSHDLADYRGRIVVLDFWATWCQPCLATMPALQSLADRFRDEPVSVLGLNAWDDGEPAVYMHSKGYTYTVLLGADEVAAHYGVSGLPTLVVIDAQGKVLDVRVGYDPDLARTLGDLISRHLGPAPR